MNIPLHCLLLQTPGELLEGKKTSSGWGMPWKPFLSCRTPPAWMMRNRKNFRCMPMPPAGAMATCLWFVPAVLLWSGCLPIPAGRRRIMPDNEPAQVRRNIRQTQNSNCRCAQTVETQRGKSPPVSFRCWRILFNVSEFLQQSVEFDGKFARRMIRLRVTHCRYRKYVIARTVASRLSRTSFKGKMMGLFMCLLVFWAVIEMIPPSMSICFHWRVAMSPKRWPPV